MDKRFGLLGRKLGHSWSPQIHGLLCGYDYGLYEVEPEALASFLTETPLAGMNVTIPYKKDVLPFCATLSDAAKRIGSVNTLVRTADGWFGDNTDCAGFLTMARRSGVPVEGRKVLVFGTGGASLAVKEALRQLAASYECDQLARVVDSMVRSLRFGSALADILEEAAAQSRATYRTALEERVAKAPVKMMVPTGALILPAMLLLVMGPILLELAGGF